MTYRGTVQSGVVVLEGGVELPNGTHVLVELVETSASPQTEDPLYRLAELARPTGIPDLALNIDHYLYSHPKASDANQRPCVREAGFRCLLPTTG